MDPSQASCAHCGAPSSGGRFCTNCGARLDTLPPATEHGPTTDTAERVYAVPAHAAPHRGPGPGVWFAMAGALVVILLLGGWLLARGVGGGSSSAASPVASSPTHHPRSASSPPSPSPTTQRPSSPAPTATPKGPATDVAGLARATAPAHAPAGVDLDGRPVTFVAANLVDGAADTCWRRPGDASGTVLTFRLDQPTRLIKVGLINGYAKVAFAGHRRYDWYHGNRRVVAVSWVFDDGTTVGQHLTETTAMQTIPIKPVTTRTVRLRIDAVTPPGRGIARRNETAISEVSLVGRTP
jgi:hypothetical protein